MAVAFDDLRWTPIRAFDPFHRRDADPRLHRRSSGNGDSGRPDQRSAIDDHRALSASTGKAVIDRITRRRLIGSIGLGAGGLVLAGCDKVGRTAAFGSAQMS